MAKNNLFEQKKEYVKSLEKALAPMQDFGGIEYAYDPRVWTEYVKIWDTLGGVAFLDVTGYTQESILYDVAKIVLRLSPKSLVTSTPLKRKIVKLF